MAFGSLAENQRAWQQQHAAKKTAHQKQVHATADALWKAIHAKDEPTVARLMAELKRLTEGKTVSSAA